MLPLQLAAELRIPVKGTHVYAFAEHGNDLGSSKDVKGNPTEVYRRLGHGSSYGAGVKLGLVRAEYAVDHNSGTGAFFFRFGERFWDAIGFIFLKDILFIRFLDNLLEFFVVS
jgi:hypothetical protein